MRVIIFGCGGVGSHLAYLMRKINADKETGISEVILVDYDIVEQKNVLRQHFLDYNVGSLKAIALTDTLQNEEIPFYSNTMKIEDKAQLSFFNKDDLAIICTDNMESKLLIASYFINFLMVGCDKDYYEIRNFISESDKRVWGSGYNSTQTLLSNLLSAINVFELIKTFNQDWNISVKIDLKVNIKNINGRLATEVIECVKKPTKKQ